MGPWTRYTPKHLNQSPSKWARPVTILLAWYQTWSRTLDSLSGIQVWSLDIGVISENFLKMGIKISWNICKMRNDHCFNYASINPRSIKLKNLHALWEWNITNSFFESSGLIGFPLDLWRPPPANFLKLNFDGSYNPFTHSAGIGGIIRSSTITLIALYSGKVAVKGSPLCWDSIVAEKGGVLHWIRHFKFDNWRGQACVSGITSATRKPVLGCNDNMEEDDSRSISNSMVGGEIFHCSSNILENGPAKLENPSVSTFKANIPPPIHELCIHDIQT